MGDNNTVEELKQQLEEAKAENQRLIQDMKYRDKLTGLWNRKYAEMLIEQGQMGADSPDFTVVNIEVDHLDVVNAKSGPDVGDALVKQIAEGVQESFGEEAICCKISGAKLFVYLVATVMELDAKVKNLDKFIYKVKSSTSDIDVCYGYARHDSHPDKDPDALMKEAEYDLQMFKAGQESAEDMPEVPRKKRAVGDAVKILMIDDSMVNLRAIQMMLKDTYQILMTTSGMEGYEIAKKKNPDLILLDYNMPVVDGERIMQLLKKSNITKNIPVIFVSGVSDKNKILKVATLKPAGYLLKPVQKDNLLSVINTVLQS